MATARKAVMMVEQVATAVEAEVTAGVAMEEGSEGTLESMVDTH